MRSIFSEIVGSRKGFLGSSRPGIDAINKFFLSLCLAHKGLVHKPGRMPIFLMSSASFFISPNLLLGTAKSSPQQQSSGNKGDLIAQPASITEKGGLSESLANAAIKEVVSRISCAELFP